MKLTRRFLALLLALSMSLSLVTPAFASELETEETAEPVVAAETEAVEVVETEAAKPETEAPEVVETEAPEVVATEAPEVETEAPASASLVAAAPAANAEGTELAEYEVDYETQLVIGENALTLLTTATTTIYEFSPEEAGIYQFAADDANALVGYWGAGSHYVGDQTENKTNTLEYTLTNAGPSIMVGISGVESCTLTVTRLGDAVVEPSYEKVDYTNVVTPEAYTMPEAATDLVYVDVTDDVADAAVLVEDGYYHLNTADGPILFVDLGYNAPYGARLANAAGYGSVKVSEYDENGKVVKVVNYLPAIEAYQACVASATVGETEASLYPLTEDLMIMYQKIGADKGWYDADTITGFFLFEGYTIDEETAWLFSCCYSQGYTVAEPSEDTEEPEATVGTKESPIVLTDLAELQASATDDGAYDGVWYQYTAAASGIWTMTLSETSAYLDIFYDEIKDWGDKWDENGVAKFDVAAEQVIYLHVYGDSGAFDITITGEFEEGARLPIESYTPVYKTEVIPAGGKLEYVIGNIAGQIVTIEDPDAAIIYNGITYEAVDGVVTVQTEEGMYYGAMTSLTIVNNGEEDKAFSISYAYPVGDLNNPDTVEAGDHTIALEENSEYYYNWTAPDDGEMTFTMNSESGWQYTVNPMSGGENHYCDDDPVVTSETLRVSKGEEVMIVVANYDPTAWPYPAVELDFTIAFVGDPGTESNPFELGYDKWTMAGEDEAPLFATASVDVPANTTYYYSVNGMFSGLNLSVDGGEATLLPTVNVRSGEMIIFPVSNDTDAEKSMTLTLSYPLGTQQNPAELVEGENVATVTEDNWYGYQFSWTAPDRGELTITMSDDNAGGWSYQINNITTRGSTDMHSSADEKPVASETIAVNKGDVITIMINTAVDPELGMTPAGTVSFTMAYEAVLGSESNPISPELKWNKALTEATVTVEVPAGVTNYYVLERQTAGMSLSINGGEATILQGGFFMPVVFNISNDGETEAEYDVRIYWPLGYSANPDKLVMGSNSAVISGNSAEDYNYTWTAPMNGELTITMGDENENGWMYEIQRISADETVIGTERHWHDDAEVVASETIAVSAGDVVKVMVNTYDSETYGATAGTVNFTAEFSTDLSITSGKSTTLKFVNPNTGKKVSGSKVAWTIQAAYIRNPFADEYENAESEIMVVGDDIAAYATINKSGKLKTYKCGDNVSLYITGTLKSDPTVVIGYYVDLYPASTKLAIRDEFGDVVMGNWPLDLSGEYDETNAPSLQFYAYAWPENATQDVTWKSSNTKIAKVSADGVITPVWNAKKGEFKTGEVTITATAKDGSGKKASFKVGVYKFAHSLDITMSDDTAIPFEGNIQDEWFASNYSDTVKTIHLEPGAKITLKANVDSNATKKNYTWFDWSGSDYVTIKKNTITVSKTAPVGHEIIISAYANYGLGAQDYVRIVVEPSSAPAGIKISEVGYEILGYETDEYGNYICDEEGYLIPIYATDEEGNSVIGNPVEDTITYDTSYMTSEEDAYYLCFLARVYDAEGNFTVEDVEWKSSNTKIATVEEYEDEDFGHCVALKPVWTKSGFKTGTVTLTATTSDGTVKDTITIKFTRAVTSCEIQVKEGKQWISATNLNATAGQTINLKAVINTNASVKGVYWYAYEVIGDYYTATSDIKISSSGKVTLAKDIAETKNFVVIAQPKGDQYCDTPRLFITVKPRAVNVHARAEVYGDDRMIYVSNTTRDWDVTTDGKELKLSALVYPFDASQAVKWTSSNNKVAKIVTYEDENGDTQSKVVFTGTKYGKVTFVATAQDGTKQKASFTLNVSASIDNLELPEELATYSKKSMNLANMVVFNGGEITPSNKTLTWKLYELVPVLDANGEVVTDDLGAVIHNWQECAKNNGSAAKLTSKGVFTAKTVKEYTYVKVEASKGDIKDEVYIEIYPAGVNNIKAEAFSGMKNVDGEEISVVFDIDSIVTVEKNGVITTTDDIVALSAWSANNKWTAPFAYEVDNENFVVELVTLLFPAGVDDEGNAIYEEGVAYAVYAADEQNPYGTVNVTIKSTDGTNKTLPFTVVFEAPVEEPAE